MSFISYLIFILTVTPRFLWHLKEPLIQLTIAARSLAKQVGQGSLQGLLLLTKQGSTLWQGKQRSTHFPALLYLSSFISSSHTALPFSYLATNNILKTCPCFLISFLGFSIHLELLIPPNMYSPIEILPQSHLCATHWRKGISPLNSKAFGLCFLWR